LDHANFPVSLTSFIGREQDVEGILQLLATSRLLTLTGPGGVGKTRLLIEVARAALPEFKAGGGWVDLASLTDPALVPQAIAKALEINETSNQPLLKTITNQLRSKQYLLVLDNIEQLLAACAGLADQLLSACPDLKILSASREEMGLFGETIWQVASLPFPEFQPLLPGSVIVEFASVRLFVERAGSARPGFKLTDGNAPVIAQICQKLDGIPLAIELAAARIKILSVNEIAAHLVDRFDLLTGGSRTSLPRHQTLRATIDWSYELLTEPERALFRGLSIFAGCFRMQAAEEIIRSNQQTPDRAIFFDALTQLVNKSLITVEAEAQDSTRETRYNMLETIRAYGREKLAGSGEMPAVAGRYRDYYLKFLDENGPKMFNQEQKAGLEQIEAEYDNLRAAIQSALEEKDLEAAGSYILRLCHFWVIRGYNSEAQIWLDRLLALPGSVDGRRARLLFERGHLAMIQASYEQALLFAEASIKISSTKENLFDQALGRVLLGMINVLRGDREQGIVFLEESLATFREMGDAWQIARALVWLSDTYNRMGNIKKAAVLCKECLEIFTRLGDPWGTAFATGNAGEIARQAGDFRQAKAYFRKNLSLHLEHGHKGETPYTLESLAILAVQEKDFQWAARLWGTAEAFRERTNAPLPPAYEQDYRKYKSRALQRLGERAFAAAQSAGRALSPEAVLALASGDEAPFQETSSRAMAGETPGSNDLENLQAAGLTRREAEILRLVATGLTDAQVAEKLFLSPRTVSKHLQSIYAKLHVTSRTAAARAALEGKMIE
jgi:predicted ATPase/DNA-binding CsgD family transcriptional regulator